MHPPQGNFSHNLALWIATRTIHTGQPFEAVFYMQKSTSELPKCEWVLYFFEDIGTREPL